MLAICTRLNEKKLLHSDAVNDMIAGLSICNNIGFAKTSEVYKTIRNKTLMTGVKLSESTWEQINTILIAVNQVTSLCLGEEWIGIHHLANTVSVGVSCDNYWGHHYVNNCKKPKDNNQIVKNCKLRQGGGSTSCNG